MNNPNVEAQKGDVLWVTDNKSNANRQPHYIVYLEIYPKDNDFFIGAMLTHSSTGGNIPLQSDHFVEVDENGNNYQVGFDKSLVINHPLYKKGDFLPFTKVGRLTQKGIAFIEENIAPYVVQFLPKDIK